MIGTALIAGTLAERSRAMALRLGERLLREAQTPQSLTRGLAHGSGAALVLDALGRTTGDSRYREAAHVCLRQVVRSDDVPSIGLFSGISGLRAVAALFALEEPAYRNVVDQVDAYVEDELPELENATVTRNVDFDVIAGWSGARLARCVTSEKARDRLVDLLVWLAADDARWCCRHPVRPEEPPENDLGLAHGIAGVIATLALTAPSGDSAVDERLSFQARQLERLAMRSDGRVCWSHAAQSKEESRSAWCYGTPGIAAALYWAAQRLGDKELEQFALAALETEAALPFEQWSVSDYALCHGVLGNAIVYASVGDAAGSAPLRAAVRTAVEHAVDGLERDDAACWGVSGDNKRDDLSGELDGAAGIALALLTLCGDVSSNWFLLHALRPFSS